jgi:hypothetical protein
MKNYRGIRYGLRPSSYWEDPDPLGAILRNVKGQIRREIIAAHWKAGRLEELPAALLQDELDDEWRQRLGQIHPSCMGGEYLPPYLEREVEIARLRLQSMTCDVIALRARPVPEGIAYRVVDEYGARFTLLIPVSVQPLALAEVIRQLDEGTQDGCPTAGGISLGYNVRSSGHSDRRSLRHFTRIQSTVYRQLGRHFERVFEDWTNEAAALTEASAPRPRSASRGPGRGSGS